MLSYNDRRVILAYRLEDHYGNSPYYYNGYKAILPDGYLCAYLNPCRFRESDYERFIHKLDIYEYLLYPTAKILEGNEVLFKPKDIISKSKTGW